MKKVRALGLVPIIETIANAHINNTQSQLNPNIKGFIWFKYIYYVL